jgi:hypothetical protein
VKASRDIEQGAVVTLSARVRLDNEFCDELALDISNNNGNNHNYEHGEVDEDVDNELMTTGGEDSHPNHHVMDEDEEADGENDAADEDGDESDVNEDDGTSYDDSSRK